MATKSHLRFTEYLTLQRVAPSTKESYLRAVAGLADYYSSRQPELLTNEQIQDYLLYNIQEKKLAWSSCNVLFCGLKKYYQNFLGRTITEFTIPPRTRSKKLPMLLSRKEVSRILETTNNLKHRALLATVYSSGLRVSEVVKLRPEHIESSRMMIRVEEGKGNKGRYTVLSKYCLGLLREYWREYQPGEWLFFGQNKKVPMSIATAQRVYYQAKDRAMVTKGRGIHTLRHCFASHLLDDGTEIYVIKRWMGHSSIRTTYKYIHLPPDYLKKFINPLDKLYLGGTA